jgi:hypothetical protein
MIPHIITKLQNEISVGLRTEAQVVYVLAEIRKIIEQNDLEENYKYLLFHCNWALHSKMDRAAAQEVLVHFDEAHAILRSGIELHDLPTELQREIKAISGMTKFEEELSLFLQNHQIIDLTANGPDSWPHFLQLYAGVIEDCPLVIKQNNNSSGVTKVTVHLEKAARQVSGQNYYKISWEVTDRSGASGEIFVINSFS